MLLHLFDGCSITSQRLKITTKGAFFFCFLEWILDTVCNCFWSWKEFFWGVQEIWAAVRVQLLLIDLVLTDTVIGLTVMQAFNNVVKPNTTTWHNPAKWLDKVTGYNLSITISSFLSEPQLNASHNSGSLMSKKINLPNTLLHILCSSFAKG